jgi:MFS transporter, OFA family, oxalate/formate antiporter
MSVPVRGTDDGESRALSPMSTVSRSPATAQASDATRWGQLIFGIICMVMIANLQYGWTLFVIPIDQKYHWGRPAIQVAFTIFVLTETWLVPFEGYLIDRFGPRVMICGSGALVAIAWVINSVADSLFLLYVGAAIGGIGAGVIYGGSVGNALKWFPDRRGLAAGLTAAGFGADSVLTIIPIASMIQTSGYQATSRLPGRPNPLRMRRYGDQRLLHRELPLTCKVSPISWRPLSFKTKGEIVGG